MGRLSDCQVWRKTSSIFRTSIDHYQTSAHQRHRHCRCAADAASRVVPLATLEVQASSMAVDSEIHTRDHTPIPFSWGRQHILPARRSDDLCLRAVVPSNTPRVAARRGPQGHGEPPSGRPAACTRHLPRRGLSAATCPPAPWCLLPALPGTDRISRDAPAIEGGAVAAVVLQRLADASGFELARNILSNLPIQSQ